MAVPDSLWLLIERQPPFTYVADELVRRGARVRIRSWNEPEPDGGRALGRIVNLQRGDRPRGHLLNVNVIGTRALRLLWDAPEPLVVVNEINLAALYAVLSKLRRRGRRVISLIEGDITRMGATGNVWWKMVFRRLLTPFMDGFVANTAATAVYLRRLGVPARRIVTAWWLSGLPDGLEATPLPEAVLATREGPVFLTVGRLVALKGLDLLLAAHAGLVRASGPATLWIVGDGPERATLEEQARTLGIAGHVHFLGRLDHAQLLGALEACDAFVFPTLADLVGRALVEALSAGTPVLTTAVTQAADELVVDGHNGVIVDPHDHEAFAAALARLADPAERARLAEGARTTSPQVSPAVAADGITEAARRAFAR